MQKEIINKLHIRFPEFKDEWSNYNLGEICDKKSSNISANKIEKNKGDYKIYGASGLLQFVDFFIEEENYISIVKDGAGVGNLFFCDKKSSVLGTLEMIKPKEGISIGFLYPLLSNINFKKYVTGSTIPHIYFKDYSKEKVNVPSLFEQQKIANFLTSIDTQIQTLEKKKTLLEQYKKGILQKIFKQELRFKDDNGNAFPEWEKLQLIDIAERVKTKNKIDNQNVLTISAQLGLVSQLEYFNKSVSAKNLTGYYLLEKNDFAYNKSYSKGYPMGAIKRLNKYDLGVVSTLYICFRFNKKVSLDFMEQYFNAGLQNREIEKVAQEGARNHGLLNIGVNDFFEIDLKIPSLEEQIKIAKFLSAIDENIALVNTKIEHTKSYKKGLLQQMFV